MIGVTGAPARPWPDAAGPAPLDGMLVDGLMDLGAEFVVEWQVVDCPEFSTGAEDAPSN